MSQAANNAERAVCAAKAFKDYAGEGDDDEAHIVDLITDIMHYCDRNAERLDFEQLLEMAVNHHEAEVNGDD